MALQSDNLTMIGRGISADERVNPGQPPLAKGIHLRYAFARTRGFPWYGYYLFRRPHRDAKPTCVLPLQDRKTLEPGAVAWTSPQGVFRSEGPLRLDDAFAPKDQLEFDLRACRSLRFTLSPGQVAREFRVEIGFYALSAGTDGLKVPASRAVGPVRLVAYQGTVPVAQAEVSGAPGQIVAATLDADQMDSVEIVPNSCALVEICFVPALAEIANGWEQLKGVPYPLCLPSSQATYPCAGKPGSAALALAMAVGRVRYGDPSAWDAARLAEMTVFLDDLVTGGPAGGAMADRVTSQVLPGASAGDPQPPDISPLDMLVFGSLDPAVAQVLGLYWVDDTALENTAYDYVVLADHDNSFQGKVASALSAMNAAALPANVDGWITFNLKLGPAPVLAAPDSPLCYALPGGVVASSEPGAVAPSGTNTVGLRWTLPLTSDNDLLPNSAIFYHLWRLDLGATAPAAAPSAASYTLLTAGAPIIVGDADVAAGQPAANASDWPPFRMLVQDRRLPDGWYSYRLAGVDIFGQWSALSDPACWQQWTPAPNPRPWYYVGAGSDAVLNAYAVQVRDTTPPPAPPGVEAFALDPLDPLLVQDQPFVSWLADGWWNGRTANEKAAGIGVRVTWRWTKQQMLQAPDTREFRLYFHPGTDPPLPDSGLSGNWATRLFIVGYGDHVSIDANGDRAYQVLLPLLGDASFQGVPLAPDNANPVAYGHIGVSAADDKMATMDNSVWQGTPFGNRGGNEGRVGIPAKIYRVLRTPPPPPGVVDTSDKVWATPANYHSLSYYTFRWPKPLADAELIDAHVFRAMDEALFEYDFRQRPRLPLDVGDDSLFPVASWSAVTRASIKTELDALNALTPLLAGDDLPTTTSKIRNALQSYRALSDNALRTLASLPAEEGSAPKPGNEGAFSQLTYQPLMHTPENADRIGPDGSDSYVPLSALAAYLAEIDGRAQNRYFYRAAFVNHAHDMGPLGPSSPPVYLPKVEPPRTPVITKILGGDRQITITFASNREADLAEYRIYRADNARTARDIRLMDLVGTVAQANIDPIDAGTAWTDSAGLIGGRQYYYRLVAVDAAGNVSPPTSPQIGVPIDARVPIAPYWVESSWHLLSVSDNVLTDWPANDIVPPGHVATLQIVWVSDTPDPTFSISRRPKDRQQVWQDVTVPAGGIDASKQPVYSALDTKAALEADSEYRIRVRSPSGLWSIEDQILPVSPPGSS